MSQGQSDESKGKERLGRCLVGGLGVARDGTVTIVKPRELPPSSETKHRKAD